MLGVTVLGTAMSCGDVQASARGGVVRVGLRGDRVLLGGQAITVLTGELHAWSTRRGA